MVLRLRDHTDLAQAAQSVRGAVARAQNLQGSTTDLEAFASQYVQWVDETERVLRAFFLDPETWEGLLTQRYWHITRIDEASFRPWDVLRREVATQCERLEKLALQVDAYSERLEAAPGLMTVLDTNVLLHYQTPRSVSWREVVSADQVRLILPLRVIEELDEKKYLTTAHTADRARRILRQLWALLEDSAGSPVPLKTDVTVEVPLDDGPRHRPKDADQEVLDLCRDLIAVGKPLVLVTADIGLSLRAKACGVSVCRMPDCYRRLRQPSG